MGADKTAILPCSCPHTANTSNTLNNAHRHDRELQYVVCYINNSIITNNQYSNQELFGRVGGIRFDDAEFGKGSIFVTIVDDGYSEGFKILAWV
jgi:hypothetical protein